MEYHLLELTSVAVSIIMYASWNWSLLSYLYPNLRPLTTDLEFVVVRTFVAAVSAR